MGCQGTTPPIHPPMDVYTCCWIWAERSGEVDLPWSLTGLPKLDSGADISAIQLVGHQMSSKEIGDLYCQVYALTRLPRPPPCRPERTQEITEDIVSSLKDHLRWRKGELPGRGGELESASMCPSSLRGRWDTLEEWELTEAREAHWWALVTVTTLEEHIEGLSWSTTRMQPDVHHHLPSWDQWRRRSLGQSHRHCRAPPKEGQSHWSPPLSPTSSHQWVAFLDPRRTSEEEKVCGQASDDLDLGPHQSWGWTLNTSCGSWPPCKGRMEGAIFLKNPQQMTMKSGLSGRDEESTHPIGGESWEDSGGKWLLGASPEDKGLLQAPPEWWVKSMMSKITIWHLQPPSASARRNSYHLQTQCSPARISGRDSCRRLWHMCKPYSIGQRSLTCWC